MKLEFFKRPAPEQALIIQETAARRGLLPVMVEKEQLDHPGCAWPWQLANRRGPQA